MNKNYLNYINFQTNPTHKTSLKDITQQETSTSPYPQQHNSQHPHTNIPNAFNPINPINRNAYLNPAPEPRQEPPKQTSYRNSNSKDQFGSRQSQELISSKKELAKSNSKTSSQGFNRVSCDSDSSSKPPLHTTEKDKYNPTSNYSKTVDFGSLKYQQQQLDSSAHSTSDEADLKSRLNYLEVI